jgi:thiamine-phosphate pyrophosphorylase
MASRQQLADARPSSPRLLLVTQTIGGPAAIAGGLGEALGAGDVAAVLVRLVDADERTLIEQVQAFAAPVQNAGAALLIAGHPDIVVRSGADGAHVSGTEIKAALDLLKPDHVVGAGALPSRHDAMSAGEAGADYVMFGEPDAHGHRPSFAAIVERVQWWAELFVVPCVAYATSFEEVEALCAAGADFIAAESLVFADPRGARAAVSDLMARLHVVETAG